MPNTKSAKKRLRQDTVRRARNRSVRAAVRTQLRKVRELAAAGQLDQARGEFRLLAKSLDQAHAKGVLHANTVARLKSRTSRRLKAVKATATGS
jgi:small subunit ribosomal protein S20